MPSISPTREPIRPPKIRKYRVIVIAGGTRVWPQMRRIRATSRRTMVMKRRAVALADWSSASARSAARSCGRPPRCCRRSGSRTVPPGGWSWCASSARVMPAASSAANTPLRSIARGISRSMVWSSSCSRVAPSIAGSVAGSAAFDIEQEAFDVELGQQGFHRPFLDDPALVDDREIAAEALGFFEIMRGEDDGGAGGVDLLQRLPHAAADLDVDAGGGLVQDQQPRVRSSSRGRSSVAVSCRRTACGSSCRPCPTAALPSA